MYRYFVSTSGCQLIETFKSTKVFQRDSFLKAAERAAEHTWKEAMTIAKVGIEEARRAPELSVALVQYDANGQKGKLADLRMNFSGKRFVLAMR